jgi:hypothetical protein
MITALIVATPLYPLMPTAGLDASWMYATNQAVAQGLAFGREVVFTFGPYGAIYSQQFHPGTDVLSIGAGLFFGVCFGAVSILLALRSFWWGLGLLLVIGGQMYVRDVVFTSYGLLLTVAINNAVSSTLNHQRNISRVESALFVVLLFALGLLPLIKGSFIASAAATAVAAFCLFLTAGSMFLAAASILVPAIAIIAFWVLVGQSLPDLPLYFSNMSQIISGYTEAMAVDGDFREVVVYIIASLGIFYLVLTMSVRPWTKISLFIAFGIFLFLAFKGGFVRHDSHSFFAAAAIILAPLAIGLSVPKSRDRLSLLWLCVVAWLVIDGAYIRSLPDIVYFNLFKTYAQGVEGLRERVLKSADLNQAFSQHLAALAQEANLPKLFGKTDIYNYGQADLLASGNTWHPRPVLQSYSAYTPHLAQLDREHLAGRDAPDNLLFRLETIDGRFPSLDDGPSWPVLLAKYTPSDEMTESDYLLLKRRATAAEPQLREVMSRTFRLEQTFQLPEARMLYAQFNVRPSFFGRLASFLYKTDPLRISVTLASGRTRDFRIVSGMARAGFLLSPMVENTKELFYLFGDPNALHENVVRSMRIDGDSLFWSLEYGVRISALDAGAEDAVVDRTKIAQAVTEGPPLGLRVSQVDRCEGSIDFINGQPSASATKIATLVSVGGWMTIVGKDGVTPDNVFAVLTTEDGHTLYVKSRRVVRPDVNAYFGQPNMRKPGFTVTIDTSNLSDHLTLSLAREVDNRIELCDNLKLTLSRGDAP